MRNFAVCGKKVSGLLPGNDSIETVEIAGYPVTCGIIPSKEPDFDGRKPGYEATALLRVKAFSCNYRDMNLIFTALTKGVDESFYPIGSEFVGEVIEVGQQVTGLNVGDRVIADSYYHGGGRFPIYQGLATNNASKEYQVLPAEKLIKIPRGMSDEVAAAFSIGAQTTYSMVRKLALTEGSNVLVTAAKSNTSLFAINALKARGMNVYASTTSPQFNEQLTDLGVKELFLVEPELDNFNSHERIKEFVAETGGFDAVVDPFFDLHLPKVLDVMGPGGRYVTCGLHEQYQRTIGREPASYPQLSLKKLMIKAMFKNLHIIGNCIGTTEDLRQALDDYSSGSLKVQLDLVYSGKQSGAFLDRTYNSRERFGKVVFRYDSQPAFGPGGTHPGSPPQG